MSHKKPSGPSRRRRRQNRIQQIFFGVLAFVIIAAFLVSLVS